MRTTPIRRREAAIINGFDRLGQRSYQGDTGAGAGGRSARGFGLSAGARDSGLLEGSDEPGPWPAGAAGRVPRAHGSEPMAPQYIFTIENLSKAYGKKEVLKDIWLSFYPGAKIGVLGGNGSGKSTLLRIMAGVDKDFLGTARPGPGTTDRLPPAGADARPDQDRPRQRRAGRRARPGACSTGSTRSTPGSASRSTPTRWTSCSTSRARSRTPSRRPRAGTSTAGSRSPWTPCGSRRATPTSPPSPAASGGASPSARSCSNGPTSSCSTSRRTTSTPRASPGSNATSRSIPGTVVAVTHDRYFLDNVAGWILELDRGQGIPWQGNYSSWLEQKQERLAKEEKQESNRRKTLARELEWVRMAPRARVAKNRARLQRYEQLASQDAEKRDEAIVLQIPPGAAPRRPRRRGRARQEGLRRPPPRRGHDLPPPPRRDHRRRSAPTARARRPSSG